MPKVFTNEERDKALTVLALTGSSVVAAKELKHAGIELDESTLRDWKNVRHVERFHEISTTIAPQIAEKLAADSEEIVNLCTEIERKALEQLGEKLTDDRLRAPEFAQVLKNVSQAKGVNFDKISSVVRQRPRITKVEHDMDSLLNRLDRLFPNRGLVVDTTAEEIPPAKELSAAPAVS